MITRDGGHLALGLAGGVCAATIVLLALDIVELPFLLTDGIVGAIVGGLIAGGVAIAGQVLVILAELNVLEGADRKSKRVAAQGIFLKCHAIYDYTRKAHNYYRTFDVTSILRLQNVANDGSVLKETLLWKPIRSKKSPIYFDIDEKKFSLDVKRAELFNLLIDLEASFEQLSFIEAGYTDKFDELEKAQFRGNLKEIDGKHVVSEGQVNPLVIMELEDLLMHLRRLCVSTLEHVTATNYLVIEILSKDHQLKVTLEDKVDSSGVLYNH